MMKRNRYKSSILLVNKLPKVFVILIIILGLFVCVASAEPQLTVNVYGPDTNQKLLPNSEYLFIITLTVYGDDVNTAYVNITVNYANAYVVYPGDFNSFRQKAINNGMGFNIVVYHNGTVKKDITLSCIIGVRPFRDASKISVRAVGYAEYYVWIYKQKISSNEVKLTYEVSETAKLTPKEYIIYLTQQRMNMTKSLYNILLNETKQEACNLFRISVCEIYSIVEELTKNAILEELETQIPPKFQLLYELYKLPAMGKEDETTLSIQTILLSLQVFWSKRCDIMTTSEWNRYLDDLNGSPNNLLKSNLQSNLFESIKTEKESWQSEDFDKLNSILNNELNLYKDIEYLSSKLVDISKGKGWVFGVAYFKFVHKYARAEENLIKTFLLNASKEPYLILVDKLPKSINLKELESVELTFKVKNTGGFVNGTEAHLVVSVSDGLEIVNYSSSDASMKFKMLDSNTLDCYSNYKPEEIKIIKIKVKAKRFKSGNQFIKYTLKALPLIKSKNPKNYITGSKGKISVKVTPINWPPEIVEYYPKSPVIWLKEKEKITFSVDVYDRDTSELDYKWLLNGEVVAVGKNSYTFEAKVGYGGRSFEVEFVASDGWSEVRHKWIVYVSRNIWIGHNLRLESIEVSDTNFYSGETAEFKVYVNNIGNYTETCNVSLVITNSSGYLTEISSDEPLKIESGYLDSASIYWRIPENAKGYYTVTAVINPIGNGDEDYSDNLASIVIYVRRSPPNEIIHKSYLYSVFSSEWNPNYQIPEWYPKGAMVETWQAPNSHTYTFEIGGIAFGLGEDNHHGIGMNILKDGKYIYKTLVGNRPATWLSDTRSYYFDDYKLIIWDITYLEGVNGNDMLWFKAGIPTSDVEITPFESYCRVGEICNVTIKLPPGLKYDINPEVWECNKNKQPDILKKKFKFFKTAYSNGNTVILEFEPTEPGTFVFAVDGIRIHGTNYGYLVFGILHVGEYAKPSSGEVYYENITDSGDISHTNSIKSVSQIVSEDSITFRLSYDSLNMSNLITLVFLDTDKDPKTGYHVNQLLIKYDLLSKPIGADYVIEIVRLPSCGTIQTDNNIPIPYLSIPYSSILTGYLLKWDGKTFSLIREIPVYSDTNIIEFSVPISEIDSNRADVVVASGWFDQYLGWYEPVYSPLFIDVAPDYKVTTWNRLYSDSLELPINVPDIKDVYINTDNDIVSIKIEMNNSINTSEFCGIIFIDADRNAMTGCPVSDYINKINRIGGMTYPMPDIGAEYLIRIYPSPPLAQSSILLAELGEWNDKNGNFEWKHALQVHKDENSVWVSVPASFIGNNTNIRLAVAVGIAHYNEWSGEYEYTITDVAPDFKVKNWVKLTSDRREYAPPPGVEVPLPPDIKNVYINLTDKILSLKVEMYNPINFSNFICMVFIDADRNSSTGCSVNDYLSKVNKGSDGPLLLTSNIGAEYAVEIRESYATVYEWNKNYFNCVGPLPVHSTINSIWVPIPLSMIGGSGNVKMAVAVGEITECEQYCEPYTMEPYKITYTDVAPDFNVTKWKEIFSDFKDVKLPELPDIRSVYLNVTDGILSIKVETYSQINFSNFMCAVFIDADKDPSTGCPVKEYIATEYGYDAHKLPEMGADYMLQIFGNFATLFRWKVYEWGQDFEPITYLLLVHTAKNSIWVSLPISMIGNSRDIKLAVAVGIYENTEYEWNCVFTDTAPDIILYVPDDFSSIQKAIDAATAGDIIIVKDGTYVENVVVYKPLTIMAENSAKTKIIPRDRSKPVFTILNDNVTISGFNISCGSVGIEVFGRNCKILKNEITNNDIGIRVLNSSSVNISFNRIIDNRIGIVVGGDAQAKQTGNILVNIYNIKKASYSLPPAPIPEVATVGLFVAGLLILRLRQSGKI